MVGDRLQQVLRLDLSEVRTSVSSAIEITPATWHPSLANFSIWPLTGVQSQSAVFSTWGHSLKNPV